MKKKITIFVEHLKLTFFFAGSGSFFAFDAFVTFDAFDTLPFSAATFFTSAL